MKKKVYVRFALSLLSICVSGMCHMPYAHVPSASWWVCTKGRFVCAKRIRTIEIRAIDTKKMKEKKKKTKANRLKWKITCYTPSLRQIEYDTNLCAVAILEWVHIVCVKDTAPIASSTRSISVCNECATILCCGIWCARSARIAVDGMQCRSSRPITVRPFHIACAKSCRMFRFNFFRCVYWKNLQNLEFFVDFFFCFLR